MVLYALLPYLRLILTEILTEWKQLLSSVSMLLETHQHQHKSKKPSSSKIFLH